MAKAAAAVAVGLLIGLALGVFLGHPPVTFTTTKHTTITEAVTTTSLKTSTTVRTVTSITTYTTFRATTTVIITQTVYPAETPEILLTEHDIGNKKTKPFTVANTTDLQIAFTVKATGPVSELRFQIQLIQFGDVFVKWSREVRGREGSFDNHIVGVKPGNYLLQINSNCEWEVVVKKVF
ncbi:MAG: hypothetical protein QW420_04835 [Candidatus Caldarchaeum sp.]